MANISEVFGNLEVVFKDKRKEKDLSMALEDAFTAFSYSSPAEVNKTDEKNAYTLNMCGRYTLKLNLEWLETESVESSALINLFDSEEIEEIKLKVHDYDIGLGAYLMDLSLKRSKTGIETIYHRVYAITEYPDEYRDYDGSLDYDLIEDHLINLFLNLDDDEKKVLEENPYVFKEEL